VLVTGGGRGIGRAIALRFAEAGARVFVNFFVNREAAEKTARDIELAGGAAHLVQADLKEPAEIRRMFAEVRQAAGRLDVLVNNAASGVLKGALELSAKHWDWVMATNARPFLLCAQEAATLMSAGGRVIGLSSLGSHRVIPGYAAVGVSKAALEALTRYLAVELAPRGITVNTVSAGAVDTHVWRAIPGGEALLDQLEVALGRGRLAELDARRQRDRGSTRESRLVGDRLGDLERDVRPAERLGVLAAEEMHLGEGSGGSARDGVVRRAHRQGIGFPQTGQRALEVIAQEADVVADPAGAHVEIRESRLVCVLELVHDPADGAPSQVHPRHENMAFQLCCFLNFPHQRLKFAKIGPRARNKKYFLCHSHSCRFLSLLISYF
jgi:enoyl-[acyl-carrier protein] reductase III